MKEKMKTKKTGKTNRTAMIQVRLKPEERAKMEAEAKMKGLGLSAWLRMVALVVLDEKKKPEA